MDDKKLSVKDIMVREVIVVSPDASLIDAAKLIADHHFDGVPVVDGEKKLVGILTEYDLISQSSQVHLPTFQAILQNLQVIQGDRSQFEKEIAEISSLKVKDVMNTDPLTLPESATYEDAVTAFREHHRVNPIPVLDAEKRVVGVVSRFDILKPLRELAK